ncbi:MAG TPA: DUF4129 domain-containing protein [Puia sp.]|nr:DUF4129 domain-containing protein [Puia sp.]
MGLRLLLLTLTLLLTTLQSPAQRHHRRGYEQRTQHASRLPDSVSTSDEEIKLSSSEEGNASVDTPTEEVKVDSVQKDISTETDTSVRETPEPLVLRSIPDTAVRRWKNDHDFDYANDPSLWKQSDEKESLLQRFFNSDGFRWFIYLLLGGILLYALYKIISENNLRFFYRKPTRLKGTSLEEAELPEEDLDQLLRHALESGEYRMATRYLYLKTLRHLDSLELIRWHSQATDEEYLRQMDAKPQGGRFRWLTSAYERVWYGKFPLDEHQFARLSQYFQDFRNDIDHPQHS